jgi:hypothetical protein
MPTIHAQDLQLLATARLETARDGLLQAAVHVRTFSALPGEEPGC